MEIDAFCEYPFNRARVTSEGHVAFCCYMRSDPRNITENSYIGNLLKDNFDDIWFGSIAEDIRQSTLQGVLHKKCNVPACPYVNLKSPLKTKKVVYKEYPDFLEIDLPNTHCNVGGMNPGEKNPACIMCERSDPNFRPEEDHLFEVIEKLTYVCKHLRQIHIQGIAEPFFQNREKGFLLLDVLEKLSFASYKDAITISSTTNGTLFKPSVREWYLNEIPNSILTFSVDAASQQTFKKIRILDVFSNVVNNMRAFSEERNPASQFFRINNNINILNVHEVGAMVKLAAELKVDALVLNPTFGHKSDILVTKENCGLFKRAEMEARELADKLNVTLEMIVPLDQGLMDDLVQISL